MSFFSLPLLKMLVIVGSAIKIGFLEAIVSFKALLTVPISTTRLDYVNVFSAPETAAPANFKFFAHNFLCSAPSMLTSI